MIDDAATALISLCAALITVWFANRVHKLEDRVDVLEKEKYDDQSYIAKLRHFIYKLGHTPPDRDKE